MDKLNFIKEYHKKENEIEFKLEKIDLSFIEKMWDKSKKEFITEDYGGKLITIAKVVLPNGFFLMAESTCISRSNYDFEMGKSICERKIKEKMWELYGFFLQEITSY